MTRRVLAVLVIGLMACSENTGASTSSGVRGTEELPPPAAPPREPEMSKATRNLQAATTLTEAIAATLPEMSDEQDEISSGAAMLAGWMAHNPTVCNLSNLSVAKNETSIGLVMKDSDEARGKRMCVSGQLVEIEKFNEKPKVFLGGLVTSNYDVVNFFAVGSTGELVAKRRAKICGVVIGQRAYANVSGGQTRAVMLVGMFDLPENR